MLEELYENGIIFYAVCGICALNIIMKLIEALYCTYIFHILHKKLFRFRIVLLT